jgi:hypothetical protein
VDDLESGREQLSARTKMPPQGIASPVPPAGTGDGLSSLSGWHLGTDLTKSN